MRTTIASMRRRVRETAARRAPNLRRALRYAWAFPATAVGLLLAAIAGVLGARAAIVGGVLEVAGGRLAQAIGAVPLARDFDAITFGHVVLGADCKRLARCRAHERVHVRQYERWGALLFVLYAASSALQLVRGRHPYLDNHFEREARRGEARRAYGAVAGWKL